MDVVLAVVVLINYIVDTRCMLHHRTALIIINNLLQPDTKLVIKYLVVRKQRIGAYGNWYHVKWKSNKRQSLREHTIEHPLHVAHCSRLQGKYFCRWIGKLKSYRVDKLMFSLFIATINYWSRDHTSISMVYILKSIIDIRGHQFSNHPTIDMFKHPSKWRYAGIAQVTSSPNNTA